VKVYLIFGDDGMDVDAVANNVFDELYRPKVGV
jgi:hypothetical protein